MTWEEQLNNCIFDSSFADDKKLHLTSYMAELINNSHSQALQKQFIPNPLAQNTYFSNDYLQESEYMPVSNLIHRYKNKAVMLVTNQCACYCQFCTRQRITSNTNTDFSINNFEEIFDYIKEHSEVEDVLVSGGDPLVLSTATIVNILNKLTKISSVKIIRIGTRIPITLPQRVNTELIEELKKLL